MINISKKTISGIKNAVNNAKTAVILGHHNPDGDAVGGSAAMFEILSQIGLEVKIVMPSAVAKSIRNIPNVNRIIFHDTDAEKAEDALTNSELIFCIDFNATKRVGKLNETLSRAKGIKIMIDHHPEPEDFVDFMISETSVSSASEVVYEFIQIADYKQYMTKNAYESIFTGIMTDTNNFSVNCSQSRTFEIAAELLAEGVNRERIYDQVYNNHSEKRMRFTGYFLDKKMTIYPEFSISIGIITQKEQEAYDFEQGDQEGLVNLPLSISEVQASVLLLEHDEYLKLSFRSKSDEYDVNKLARKYFNGGGHTRAAGGKLYIPVERAEKYILTKLRDFWAK